MCEEYSVNWSWSSCCLCCCPRINAIFKSAPGAVIKIGCLFVTDSVARVQTKCTCIQMDLRVEK